jgi:uncharacterized membrane protein YcfT
MSDVQRLNWVDAAKGISILLVVMMYAAYSVGEETGGIGFLHYIIAFATPFRMPEFFLISGLFLSHVINRPWSAYADRRVVHYLYFYALWAIIHIIFKVAIVAGDPMGALAQLGEAAWQPYGVLWFIYVLALVSAATKLLATLKIPQWVGLAGAAALQIAPIATGSYAIDQFAEFFVFFYAGYMFAPMIFKFVASAMAAPFYAVAFLTLWAIGNGMLVFSPGYQMHADSMEMGLAALPGLRLALALVGSIALCTLAGLLSKLSFMNWLNWIGAHSIVIYLSFALPMSIMRVILLKLDIIPDTGLLSLVILIGAMIAPIALYALIQMTGWGKFLFERPAWAHIPGTPGSLRPKVKAKSVPAE